MQTIFLDASVTADPDLDDRLAHLVDAGHPLVLIGSVATATSPSQPWTERRPALPPDPSRGSWYITADPSTCGDRVPGLRTVLIGPRENGPRPTRCDVTVRDLREAVLEVLTADAMMGGQDSR
jgi:hypothetical protein